MKRLKFHTPDTTGNSKCHQLHVGKQNKFCPQLRVHGSKMECVQSDTYLGDTISSNGSNSENLSKRISKGNGIITHIKNILDNVSLGSYYLKIALLLRESLLINGYLTNSEVWYGLRTSEIQELENVDVTLLRMIFEVPHTVPTVSLFLETGCLTVGTIIKCCPLNFLHYLVTLEKTEMLYKFFIVQWNTEVKYDWTTEAKKNTLEFGLPQTLEFVGSKSKMFSRI